MSWRSLLGRKRRAKVYEPQRRRRPHSQAESQLTHDQKSYSRWAKIRVRVILLLLMGIRKRLLALSIGIAVPLILVGLVMLWALWQENRRELTHSIEEQSQLAAVAFEKWLDGQRQPLSTLAAIAAEHPDGPFSFEGRLSYLV